MSDDPTPQAAKPRPILPPFSRPIIIAALVLDIIVFAGVSRAGLFVVLMLITNLAVCGVAYFAILRHFERRLFETGDDPALETDHSPSRKSSPISE